MGHYRRKAYKKKSMQEYLDIDLNQELDLYQSQDIIDDVFYDAEDFLLDKEPDIVKELREEERMGMLTATLPDPPLQNLYSSMPLYKQPLGISDSKQRPANYTEAYHLAKKALQQIDLVKRL